jgi:hypothetical protein
LAWLMVGFLAALWALVPVHELLHAAGCRLTGGEVTRVELLPLFGGAWLARVIPWVTAGGHNAGRLAGFVPAGDLSYLVTVLLPHLVLAPLGAAACRRAARLGRPLVFGAALAAAAQPLASLTGDFYEAASIPLTRIASALGDPAALALRGDDLVEAARTAMASGAFVEVVLFLLTCVVGVVMGLALARLCGGCFFSPAGETAATAHAPD